MTTPRTERAPAFQCYASDELGTAARMTAEEFGHYTKLKLLAWRDVGLPTDPARLAVVLGVSLRKLPALWSVVGAEFVERAGRYVLPWMEAQRARQAERRLRNANNGRHGGRPARAAHDTPHETQSVLSGEPRPNPDESPSSFKLQASRDSAASAAARAASEVRTRLPGDDGADLDALLQRLPVEQHHAWARSLAGLLDGLHGPAVPPAALGEALREFNANGGTGVRLFRGYVARVLAPPRPAGHAPPRSGHERPLAGEVTRRNVRLGLAALTGAGTPHGRGEDAVPHTSLLVTPDRRPA